MSDNMLALSRFVAEVEQVRRALDLDRSDVYLLGHRGAAPSRSNTHSSTGRI